MEFTKKTKIVIVDDVQIKRKGIIATLSEEPNIEILCDVSNRNKLFDFLHDKTTQNPDIILLDMSLEGGYTEGVEITKKIKDEFKNIEIIINSGNFDYPYLTSNESEKKIRVKENYRVIADAMHAGAKGFISNNVEDVNEDIGRAIRCITRGERYFFNAPVLLTIVDAFLQFTKQGRDDEDMDDPETIAKKLGLDPIVDLEHLKLLAEGKKTIVIASELPTKVKEIKQKREMPMTKKENEGEYVEQTINKRQEIIARKLNVDNNSNTILVKAIQIGLIIPKEIDIPTKK